MVHPSIPASRLTLWRVAAPVAPLAGILLLAAALRFPALGQIPPGLYTDEAYNGLDALAVLAGARPIFFEANHGREPLFIYAVAASIAFLGRTPIAIRLVAAFAGTLTVAATFAMARAWFGPRLGLLAAAITAITVWPINLSRIGFRTVGLPLFTGLALWQLGQGWQTNRWRHFVAAGLFYGLSFYTYLAARFTPLAFIAFGVYLVLTCQFACRWRQLLVFAAVALLVITPLLGYWITHPGTTLERSAQVSIFNPVINQGDPVGMLIRQVGGALLMFTTRGDFIPRHNVPLRPVFDPLLAVAFVVGIVILVGRWRDPGYALAGIWLVVMLLPTILAEGAPHFLRAVGVLPVACVVPALALEAGWHWLQKRAPALAPFAVAALLILSLGFTVRDYFLEHGQSQAVYYEFETGAVELAQEINHFLANSGEAGQAYVVERLWKGWMALPFLVPASAHLTIFRPDQLSDPAPAPETLLIVWPFEDNRRALSLLPRGTTISVHSGSLEQGDLETQPRLLYVAFQATRTPAPGNIRANFDGQALLVGYDLQRSGAHSLRVRLWWQALQPPPVDYTVFVHLVAPGGLIAQDDAQPARGYYPTTAWRSGDIVVDEHILALPEHVDPAAYLAVGLYDLRTLQRVPVQDGTGVSGSDSVRITVTNGL